MIKKTILVILSTFIATVATVQSAAAQQRAKAERKFDIFVSNADRQTVESTNRSLEESQSRASRGLLTDILGAATTSGVGQVISISTNLVGLGVNTLSNALKSDRDKWLKTAQGQCRFSRVLRTDSRIDDFYSEISTKGAMDPENMKFEGFGCRNYIESLEEPGRGNEAFYLFCSLQRDQEGIDHITKHSKFKVVVDTLMFAPQFCNLPNDSTGRLDMKFDFNSRKDLVFSVKVKIFSSWVNEAILLNKDQLLGEFTITARIDPDMLKDGVFVYDKNDPRYKNLVQVTGDCFIVPRSFTGTTDARSYTPAWGTGQYRVEMEVVETCSVDEKYYQLPAEPGADPRSVKWDKNKWQPEWQLMKQAQRKSPNLFQQAVQTIVSGYTDNKWVAVITEPITTTLITSETKELKNLFNTGATAAPGATAKSTTTKPASPAQQPQQPK